ncbi:MAG: glycosyltransferase family 2 protein [Flavobacteriaceae bacterium]|nr:glycosyltransferase family 2 protein [Flavobacteriaceae bacterium]
MKFCLIIPAHNEEESIEKCLNSLVNQTHLPAEIIVVNDNSTDETANIVGQFTNAYPFVQLVHVSSSEAHQPGAKIIRAFYAGFEKVSKPFDVVCKFDADLIFPPNYLSELKQSFESDAQLGMAAGFCYIYDGQGNWMKEQLTNDDHIRGPLKAYKKECFEAIGGLKKAMGWDTLDELLARYHGWKTLTLPHLQVKHLKPTGQRYSKELARKFGVALYQMDYGFWLSLLSLLKIAMKKKKWTFLWQGINSYFKAQSKKLEKLVNPDEAKFIRNYRWKKIRERLKLL